MTSPRKEPDLLKFEAYLDGTLSGQDRESMSQQIAASPELKAEIELNIQIDAALRRSFAPAGPPPALLAKLREPTPSKPIAGRLPSRRAALIAAAMAASVVWGMLAWRYLGNRPPVPIYDPQMPLASIYQTTIAEGFKPAWVCEDDREFASTFQKRQGQGLLLAKLPEGSKMEGLTYVGGMSRYTTTMLARVDNHPVMVFVDRADADPHPALSCGGNDLHLFRKELGPLVLYELTPLDKPHVMDYLHLVEAPSP